MLLRKQAVKWYFIFPPHLTSAAALPGETESRKLHLFTYILRVLLPADTENTYYHLITAEPPFVLTRISRMHQTRPMKRVYHAIVCYHTLIVHQVCRDVDRCVKSRSCSLSSL